MRHRKHNVGLNRTRQHRRAMLANMAASLFIHKRIVTTLPKAKAARSYAERLITFARKGDLAARRQVLRKITQKPVIKELFDNIGPKYRERDGGYTRIIRLDSRVGDNAPMAILELVGYEPEDTSKSKRRQQRSRRVEGQRKDKVKAAVDKPVEAEETAPVEEETVEVAVEETTEAVVETETTEEVVEEAAAEAPVEEEKAEEPVEEAKAEEVVEEAPVEEPVAEETPSEEEKPEEDDSVKKDEEK